MESRPLVVAAYDTELFGHWWHEGPLWLDRVLRLLPQAGVHVTTLDKRSSTAPSRDRLSRTAARGGHERTGLCGGDSVADMVTDNDDLTRNWRKLVEAMRHAGYANTQRHHARPTRSQRCSRCSVTGPSWCRRTPQPTTPGGGTANTTRISAASHMPSRPLDGSNTRWGRAWNSRLRSDQ